MRYLEPVIGCLAFLWFLIGSLLAGRGRRDWQRKAEALLGLCGMSFFGVILYEELHPHSPLARILQLFRHYLTGIAIGIVITLWLEGSFNVFKKATKIDAQ